MNVNNNSVLLLLKRGGLLGLLSAVFVFSAHAGIRDEAGRFLEGFFGISGGNIGGIQNVENPEDSLSEHAKRAALEAEEKKKAEEAEAARQAKEQAVAKNKYFKDKQRSVELREEEMVETQADDRIKPPYYDFKNSLEMSYKKWQEDEPDRIAAKEEDKKRIREHVKRHAKMYQQLYARQKAAEAIFKKAWIRHEIRRRIELRRKYLIKERFKEILVEKYEDSFYKELQTYMQKRLDEGKPVQPGETVRLHLKAKN